MMYCMASNDAYGEGLYQDYLAEEARKAQEKAAAKLKEAFNNTSADSMNPHGITKSYPFGFGPPRSGGKRRGGSRRRRSRQSRRRRSRR